MSCLALLQAHVPAQLCLAQAPLLQNLPHHRAGRGLRGSSAGGGADSADLLLGGQGTGSDHMRVGRAGGSSARAGSGSAGGQALMHWGQGALEDLLPAVGEEGWGMGLGDDLFGDMQVGLLCWNDWLVMPSMWNLVWGWVGFLARVIVVPVSSLVLPLLSTSSCFLCLNVCLTPFSQATSDKDEGGAHSRGGASGSAGPSSSPRMPTGGRRSGRQAGGSEFQLVETDAPFGTLAPPTQVKGFMVPRPMCDWPNKLLAWLCGVASAFLKGSADGWWWGLRCSAKTNPVGGAHNQATIP